MPHHVVRAGLGPAIHVFLSREKQDVDARHKAGHDGERFGAIALTQETA
jgi:hypothetical protein